MALFGKNRRWLAALGLVGGMALVPAANAVAEEEGASSIEDNVSGVVGIDFYTHFISYGFDVWAGGNDFGDNSTVNPYAEVAVAIGDFSVFTGFWADLNDNGANSLGGNFQEVDVWVGVGYGYEEWSFSVIYQSWNYGGGTEHILDIGIGFDDTGLIAEDFALSPSLTIHNRIDSTDGLSGLQEGTILVAGIEPAFTIVDTDDITIDMSVPVNFGFSLEDGYFDTDGAVAGDTGYAFTSIGLSFSMPLTFIPDEYGQWSLNAGLTYYFTQDDVYNPAGDADGNQDDNFLVGSIGVSLAF